MGPYWENSPGDGLWWMVNGGGHSSQGALLDHAFYGHNGTYGDFEDLCCLPRELGSPAVFLPLK